MQSFLGGGGGAGGRGVERDILKEYTVLLENLQVESNDVISQDWCEVFYYCIVTNGEMRDVNYNFHSENLPKIRENSGDFLLVDRYFIDCLYNFLNLVIMYSFFFFWNNCSLAIYQKCSQK